MRSTRREFATQAAGGLLTRAFMRSLDHVAADPMARPNIGAVAFGAFAILIRPVSSASPTACFPALASAASGARASSIRHRH